MELQENLRRQEQIQDTLKATRAAESVRQAESAMNAIENADKLKQARKAFDQGLEYKNLGKYAEAERFFLQAIELAPQEPDYHFELAGTYAMHYDASLGRGPDPIMDKLLQGAERELEQTVMLKPEFTAAHFNLGVVLKRAGKYEKAREAFRKVIELEPNRPAPWLQIGEIYEAQGFFDEAESAYRTAQEKDYYNPDIKAALDDLAINREQAAVRARQSAGSGMLNPWREGFHPPSYSEQATAQPGAADPNQNVTQALPYLGTMLMQEFMRRRAPSDDART